MFSDDEDELELLRQYGDRDLHADDNEGHSSDLDSDLEDKIMSMVQFKKKSPIVEKAEVVVAPADKKSTSQEKFSASQELQISDDSDDEDDIGVPHDPPTPEDQLPVTRYINLDDKQYMDDEETDEEEAELNSKLQDLIDDQISKQKSKVRYSTRPIRVCFGCHQPGHERKDCKLCSDCGGLRHADNRCVGARYCGNCKMRGHNQVDCQNPRENRYCQICQIPYHNALNCPSLLHVYENEVPARKQPTAYCYNCTAKGHYGDECPILPRYLITVPSAFSQLSLSSGSRFDPKKTMKNTASSFGSASGNYNHHQRWSDNNTSRDNSPRGGNDRGGGYHDSPNKKRKYGDDDYNNRNDRYNNNDRYKNNEKKSYNPSSYKDNNAGGKRHRTDLVEDSTNNNNRSNGLNTFFVNEKKPKKNFDYGSKSGNNNWKSINNGSLPQPTRSGTVDLNHKKRHQQNYDGDFPRGNNNDLPRPSSSGVIDLTKNDSGTYSKRAPKYHGGYNRR